MKFSFKFSNLLGTVYRQGNVEFCGDSLISPVGNKVTVFDLKNNKSSTLPFENSKNISRICLSPDGRIIITVDEDGKCILANLKIGTALHYFNFKKPVLDIKFSPDGKYIAITHGKEVQVWHAPGHTREFAPFILLRNYAGLYDDTTCIDWSDDSRFFVAGSKDMTSRVYSLRHLPGFRSVTLTGHRNTVVSCYFADKSLNAYTVSSDGAVFCWHCNTSLADSNANRGSVEDPAEEEDGDGEESQEKVINWKKASKHLYNHEGWVEVTSTAFHKPSGVLTTGFSTGIFTLHEMPDFNLIHTLSISQQQISSVAVNPTGEWLAFGCSTLGQLLVWEWQSESYILKQQGHYYDMNSLAYSPDGNVIATGGDDGKVKLWNTTSGFCVVTFNEHTAGVTGVTFNHNGHVILSCSLDGTVRAFDLNRYRNFRTFTSTRRAQFSCVAVDSTGEIVCAGTLDIFDIFVWSLRTGRLLEVLAGHQSPVSEVTFSSSRGLLVSGSWDKTVRLWNIFQSKVDWETLTLGSDVLAVACRPDGEEVAVATLDGQISFWSVQAARQVKSVDGRKDLGAGRSVMDKISAQSSAFGKCFTSLCYTADGRCVLAGGRSRYVCIYHVDQQILLKKFEVSRNQSLDGMREFLDSRKMTEAGPTDLIDDDEDDMADIALPGVLKGDMSSRRTKREIRVSSVQFSPTGRAWTAATTEGLLICSLDSSVVFDPFELDPEVTPAAIRQAKSRGEFARAVVLSFRLNERGLTQEVVESVPADDIPLVVQSLSDTYVDRLLGLVAGCVESSPHVHFYLLWCVQLFTVHGRRLKTRSAEIMPLLHALQKSLVTRHDALGKVCSQNTNSLSYLMSLAQLMKEEPTSLGHESVPGKQTAFDET